MITRSFPLDFSSSGRILVLVLFFCVLMVSGCSSPSGGGNGGPGPEEPPAPVLTDQGWWGLWEVAQDGYSVQWFFGPRTGIPLSYGGREILAQSPLEFLSFDGEVLVAREKNRETGQLTGDLWHLEKVTGRRLLRTYRDPVTGESRDSGALSLLKGRSPDGKLRGTVKDLLDGRWARALDLGSLSDIKVVIQDLKDDQEEMVIVPEEDGTFSVPEVVPEAPVTVEVTGIPEGSTEPEELMEAEALPLTGDFDAGYFTVSSDEDARPLKIRLVPVYSEPRFGDRLEDVRQYQFPLSSTGFRPGWNMWLESASLPAQSVQGPLTVTMTSPEGAEYLGFFIKGNNSGVDGNRVTFSSAGPPGFGARAELTFDPPAFSGDYKDFPLDFAITLPDQEVPLTDRISLRIWKSHLPVQILSDRPVTVVYTSPEGSSRTLTGTSSGTSRVFRISIPAHFTGGLQTLAVHSASSAKVFLDLGSGASLSPGFLEPDPGTWDEPNDSEETAKAVEKGQTYLFTLVAGEWDYFTW